MSNLAWSHREVGDRLPLLEGLGLEIAPTKVWPTWKQDGFKLPLPIMAMQSLFYGQEYQLLGDEGPLFNHWQRVCNLAAELKVNRLVYGSPKLRKGDDISLALSRLDRMSRMTDALLCVEVLPRQYGAELFTDFERTFMLSVGRQWKVCLDTGAFIVSGEDPEVIDIAQVGHVHLSEPNVDIFNDLHPMQKVIASVLEDSEYTGHVTLEMPPCNTKQLQRGIRCLKQLY